MRCVIQPLYGALIPAIHSQNAQTRRGSLERYFAQHINIQLQPPGDDVDYGACMCNHKERSFLVRSEAIHTGRNSRIELTPCLRLRVRLPIEYWAGQFQGVLFRLFS